MFASHEFSKAIDDLVLSTYSFLDEPGVAVIVTQTGKVIHRKGYGIANIEFGISIEPDMVFRLGSISKQFTAIAVLMLVEQGKVALDDPITKFLPDYPTHGHLITVEHLLTHTSGIKSYTDMPEWSSVQRKDFTVEELINFFKYQPMQFAPGKRWFYNNSGYILLGAIIEKASGLTYEQFVQQNIFDVLGMKQSYYDLPQHIIPQRVCGYQKGLDGYINAEYLSMTQAYAAGALASSVDDLAKWDAALYTEQLIPQKMLQQAFTAHKLAETNYGYGWFITDYEGHQMVEHGGGIHGFATHAIRIPDECIFVAVFSNNEDKAYKVEPLTVKIATLLIGKPYQEPLPIQISSKLLASYQGVYQFLDGIEAIITYENDILCFRVKDRPPLEYIAVSPTEFILKLNSFYRLKFISNTQGVVTGAEFKYRLDPPEAAKKIAKPLPELQQ